MLPNEDVTVTLAVDFQHLGEFQFSMPTWIRHRPEIFQRRILVYCDAVESPGWWKRQFSGFCPVERMEFIPVAEDPAIPQRTRMLRSFIDLTARECVTSWSMKIDADAACVESVPGWEDPSWFTEEVGVVAHPWSYYKPISIFDQLCEWGKTVPIFGDKPEAPGVRNFEKNRVWDKRRIISFVCYTRTSYLKFLHDNADPATLPTFSQDGWLSYCSHRLGRKMARPRMDKYGWRHGAKRLREFLRISMQNPK